MTPFGTLLRETRKTRRVSQFDLAIDADVSARHISFIESGRSKPSRSMVLRLAQVMDLALNETNMMLSAAGFSAEYRESQINDPNLTEIRAALQYMMDAHEPLPATVIDDQWNILMTNQTMSLLFHYSSNIELQEDIQKPINLMEKLFDPQGFKPLIKNWQEVATFLLQRVHKEHLLSPRSAQPNELLARLLEFPDIPKNWNTTHIEVGAVPMLSMILDLGDEELQLFSTITTFGTPMDITVQNIRIEHLFPADETTRVFFKALHQQ